MEPITFETLPSAVSKLCIDVEDIKRLLQIKNEPPTETDHWFDLNELCNYLPDKPAKATVYGWITRNEVPYHKGAKKLRFLKSEIDAWLKAGKRKTTGEIKAEADNFLQTKIKRS